MASKKDRLLKSNVEELELNGDRAHKENKTEIKHTYYGRENANYNHVTITEKLQNLPKINAGKAFDQKMAAAFNLELQIETVQRNKSWLKRQSQISLPDILPNSQKNLF